jgi:hypothetical protein
MEAVRRLGGQADLGAVGDAYAGEAVGRATTAQAGALRGYLQACAERGTTPYPDGAGELARQVRGYAVSRVAAGRKSSGVASTIADLLTALDKGGRGLAAEERALVSATLAALAVQHPSVIDVPDALLDTDVLAALDYLAPYIRKRSVYALSWAAYLTTALACGRRSASLRGDDLTWGQTGRASGGRLTLYLPWDKTHKKDTSRARDTVVLAAASPTGQSPLAAMEKYAAAVGAVLGGGGEAVFPRRCKDGTIRTTVYTAGALSRDLADLMAGAGVAGRFSSKSSRRGYVTQGLVREGGEQRVLAVGGWATKTSMRRYDAGTTRIRTSAQGSAPR